MAMDKVKLKEVLKSYIQEILDLEEANTLASGNVVGYQAPLGAKGIGTDKTLEKGFWRQDAGKKVKTASPALHKKNGKKNYVEPVMEGMGEIQDVDTPTDQLHLVKTLWNKDELRKDVKTSSNIKKKNKLT
jgi:hypothetical protein